MTKGASVDYNPVPEVENTGNLGGGMPARASPDDFGAQIATATKNAGDAGFEAAQKEQGMINEAAITNADTQMAIKAGALNADYKTLSGFSAKAAFPKYQQDLEALRQETRATLPPAAQRGFDMLATRTIANHIIDGSTYAASQFKDGMRDTYSDSTDVHIQGILQQPTQQLADDEQFGHTIGTIKFNAQAQLDDEHPGLSKDPETGEVKFDESKPEGRALKAEYQQKLDTDLSRAYVNRYTTLAKTDPIAAYDKYQQDRDKIPRAGQVALDSQFAPKIFDAHKNTAVSNTVTEAQHDHYDILTNPGPQVAINTVLKNEGGLSPDGHAIYGIDKNAHPAEFLEAQSISQNQGDDAGKKYAADFYKDQYWDKNKIGDLPANTQSIVMDGAVNHTQAFTNQLIQAAKSGATPAQLIDMRRNEYQRLATFNPEKYGKYLESWNNRLDGFQVSTEGKKTYATNENGGPLTLADYYRTHSQDVLLKGDAYAEQQMPGDLAFKRAVRQTLTNQMSQTISNESTQHMMDNRNVLKAINGEMSKGQPPATEEELRQLPGMADLLDNVAARDPKFTESIPTLIAKAQKHNNVTNTANGYDAVLRALKPHSYDEPNAISSQEHLHKLLASSDETGINMKDFNDAKQAIELPPEAQPLKETLSKKMVEITNANGNVDGKGQQRALAWYNQTMEAWHKSSVGDKAVSVTDFIGSEKKPGLLPPIAAPSRMQQISDQANEASKLGKVKVVNPDGAVGYIPATRLDGALKAGYKKVE